MARSKTNTREVKNNDENKADFIYQVMQQKLMYLKDTYTTLGNKINYLMTFSGVALTYYLTIFVKPNFLNVTNPYLIFLRICTLLLLASSLFCLFMASRKRTFFDPPGIKAIYTDELLKLPLVDLKNKTLANLVKEYNDNLVPLKNVSQWVEYSSWLLLLGSAGIILSLIL